MANLIADKSGNPNGLYHRYIVTHTDGTPTDPAAIYFVLRLDSHGSDPDHIRACRSALKKYASRLVAHPRLAQLSADICNLLDDLERVPL